MTIIQRIRRAWQRRSDSVWTNVQSWGALIPNNAVRSGVQVSPESALALTAVYCAINTIATDVSSLPLKVYRRRKDGGRDEVPDHPVAVLFSGSPDGEAPAMRWRQALLGHVLGWGNGYAEVTFEGGTPTGLYLLDPSSTQPERRPQDKRLYYRHSGGTLPPYRTLHIAGLGYDGITGYSPISQAREAIGLSLAAEGFGAAFFGNGSKPSGALKTPNKLSEAAVKNLRSSWEAIHQGVDNGGRVAILEQGLEFQPISIPPEDAQFILTRQFQVIEVARLYRVPPHKLMDTTGSQFAANIESMNLDYVATTLMPWCESIEGELNWKLFTPEERAAGLYIEHQMQALLRGDMQARGEFYLRMRDLGALSPNEIRQRENLDPIEHGDIYLVPLNMTSLELAGQPPEPPEPPTPPDDEPAATDDEEDTNGDT
jgi:HK97 family phage portal protein